MSDTIYLQKRNRLVEGEEFGLCGWVTRESCLTQACVESCLTQACFGVPRKPCPSRTVHLHPSPSGSRSGFNVKRERGSEGERPTRTRRYSACALRLYPRARKDTCVSLDMLSTPASQELSAGAPSTDQHAGFLTDNHFACKFLQDQRNLISQAFRVQGSGLREAPA